MKPKYSLLQTGPLSWQIVDASGTHQLGQSVATAAIAQKMLDRWNEPETRRASAPSRVLWSDVGTLALMRVMQEYDFVIPAKRQADWRAPVDETGARLRGSLPSLSISTATLLATDGIVAYFVLGDDKTLLYGHLAAFVESTSGRAADEKREKKVSPAKANKVQAALDLLNEFFTAKG